MRNCFSQRNGNNGSVALKFLLLCGAILLITAFWCILNKPIIDDFFAARNERNLALQDLEKQRAERNRAVHNAINPHKMMTIIQARNELGYAIPGEIVIPIDDFGRTTDSLLYKAEMPTTPTTANKSEQKQLPTQ